MGIVKYLDQNPGGHEKWEPQWGRAARDGLPFRGPTVPNLKEEEFEAYAEVSRDFKSRMLNLSVKADNDEFERIVDQSVNGGLVTIMKCELLPGATAEKALVLVWYTQNYMEVPTSKYQ